MAGELCWLSLNLYANYKGKLKALSLHEPLCHKAGILESKQVPPYYGAVFWEPTYRESPCYLLGIIVGCGSIRLVTLRQKRLSFQN